ncbi:MAG: hypothetical protein ACYC63_19520 [Armatimonadota bacterium]
MNRLPLPRLLLISLMLTLALSAAVAQTPRPLLAIELPMTAGLGATAAATYEALRQSGEYDLWWLKVFEPPHEGRSIAAIVANTGAPRIDEIKDLAQYVSDGGGLVLVVPTATQWRRDNQRLLSALDVRVTDARAQAAELSLKRHAITENVPALAPLRPVRLSLQSASLDTVATQGGEPIAVAGLVGKGRVVILMEPLVAVSADVTKPEPAKAQLLAQALRWAAQSFEGTPGAGTVTGPGTPATQTPNARLTDKALIDLPADPAWTEIVTVVQDRAQRLGLSPEPFTYKKGSLTLVQGLASRPALLVIGSHRDFEDSESALIYQHVRDGGGLLALGYGRANAIRQLAALNRVLGEFGIAMTWARPAGSAEIHDHPVTRGLTGLTQAPAGSAVWAFADWPLVTVSDAALATAHEVGNGRIVVLDAATLLRPADKSADTSPAIAELLSSAMRWLTGK